MDNELSLTMQKAVEEGTMRDKVHADAEQFTVLYNALVNTLRTTYPDICKSVSDLASGEATAVMEQWREDLGSYASLVHQKDNKLWRQARDIPSLSALHLHTLWKRKALSSNSLKYLWMYMEKLVALLFDITPPPSHPSPLFGSDAASMDPMLASVQEMLGPKLMSTISKMASQHEDKLRAGECELKDIPFQDMAKQLMDDMDPDAMKSIMAGFSQMLTQNPGITELMQQIAQNAGGEVE